MVASIKIPKSILISLFATGFCGLLATIVVGTGEFLVHFSDGKLIAGESFSYFRFISGSNLRIGHWLMIAGLPLYFIGYGHLFLALQKGNRKLALVVLFLGIWAFGVGGIWAGSRGFLGSLIHLFPNGENPELFGQVIENYQFYLENLVNILRVLILLLSTVFVFTILKYKTFYPKWMAIFNPFLILAGIFVINFFVPEAGKYLVPTAMNAAHLVMFSASLIVLKFFSPEEYND